MADVSALTPVAVLAVLYAIGLSRRPIGSGRAAAGIAGVVLLAIALGPPLDVWAATNLAAHMIQHVALLCLVPPLLIVGEAPRVLTAAASGGTAARLTRASNAVAPTLRRIPLVALIALGVGLQTVSLGVWHLPAIYDAAVADPVLHAAEHLTFLLTGCFFWWTVAGAGHKTATAAAVVAIFVASLPGTLLGALMTLSTSPWYPHYATGSFSGALQNQQLAGVVMWAGGGMAYVAAGATLFVVWLRELERLSPSRVGLESVS